MQAVTSLPVCSHTTGSDTGVPVHGQLGRPVCNPGVPCTHAPPGQAAEAIPAECLASPAVGGLHLTAPGYQLAPGTAECLGAPCTATRVRLPTMYSHMSKTANHACMHCKCKSPRVMYPFYQEYCCKAGVDCSTFQQWLSHT